MLKKVIVTAALLAASGPLMAAQCSVDLEGNDAMQFNKKVIEVSKSCKDFTINLKHVGKLPKAAMGHNVVISKTADINAVGTDGVAAGAANDNVKKGDARVIAHSKLIGGGETTSATFPVASLKAGDAYSYFCSFPGHWGVMKGELKLVN